MRSVEGTGLVGNSYCDYDNGFCMPLPGYENADIRDGALVVDLLPGDVIEVIITGAAKDTLVTLPVSVTIGQYRLPTHFSVGKVTVEDNCISVVNKDVMNVQIRAMKFFTEDGLFDSYYVCLNERD